LEGVDARWDVVVDAVAADVDVDVDVVVAAYKYPYHMSEEHS
jgi:hypothetical protein